MQCSQKFFLKYRGAGAQIAESPVFSPRSRKSPVFRPQIAEKSPNSRAPNRGFGDISPDLVTLSLMPSLLGCLTITNTAQTAILKLPGLPVFQNQIIDNCVEHQEQMTLERRLRPMLLVEFEQLQDSKNAWEVRTFYVFLTRNQALICCGWNTKVYLTKQKKLHCF